MTNLIPSIIGQTAEELRIQLALLDDVSELIHVDIMDGYFVPEVSAPEVFECLEKKYHHDFHLMVSDPVVYLPKIKKQKTRFVFAHAEISAPNLEHFINRCKELKVKAGLALNIETPVGVIVPYLRFIDAVLLMTYPPGAAGRPFGKAVVQKIDQVKEVNKHLNVIVDGGINKTTSKLVKKADGAIVHSSLFAEPEKLEENYKAILKAAR